MKREEISMTEPLTPADCDLRDYVWMPLDCNRLMTSETWVLGSSDEKVASLTLWMKAWHQVPAGSLPNNDKMLAHMSEAGLKWPKVREHAMRGWVLCEDGRLYHPTVCEKAKEAWANKLAQRSRTEAARAAKAARRGTPTDVRHTSVTEPVTASVTEVATGSNRPDQTRPEQNRPSLSVGDVAPDAPRSASPTPRDRGCRIPDDWQPEDATFAARHGVDTPTAVAEFRDYWRGVPGKAGVKLDWEATWRNQVRHLAGKRAQAPPRKTSQMSPEDQNADLMRRMQAAMGQSEENPVLRLVR